MTIYVDGIVNNWSHMATDDQSQRELHEMATKIGLKRSWFQNHGIHPHYDLRPTKRQLAIEYGAIPITTKQLILKCYPRSILNATS